MRSRPTLFVSSLLLAAALTACVAQQEVAFAVRAPSDTPADATVVIRGAHDALSGGLALTGVGDGGYTGTVALPPNETISYSVALRLAGGTEIPELTRAYEPVADHALASLDGGAYVNASVNVARWDYPGTPSNPKVTFVATGPTGLGSAIYLTGNVPELGGWSPKTIALWQRPDHTFVGRAYPPASTMVEYAVTQGSWSTAEIQPDGGELFPNRTATIGTTDQTVELAISRFIPNDKSTLLTGTTEVIRNVTSTHVATRDVIVWLPPGYTDVGNTARYPVLYMHDGQNLMNGVTSFVGEWHIDEVAQRMVRLGQVEPMIIVGVYNSGSQRIADYTPVADPEYGGGNAAEYARFLVDELKPRIDSTYRTRTDAASTGVAGSSLGGLVSLYLGLTESATFGRIGVVSPSTWWSDKEILSEVSALSAKLPLKIWVDIGTNEGSGEVTVSQTRELRDALIAEGWSLGSDLAYLEVQGASHNEPSWGARADLLLRFLYPPVP